MKYAFKNSSMVTWYKGKNSFYYISMDPLMRCKFWFQPLFWYLSCTVFLNWAEGGGVKINIQKSVWCEVFIKPFQVSGSPCNCDTQFVFIFCHNLPVSKWWWKMENFVSILQAFEFFNTIHKIHFCLLIYGVYVKKKGYFIQFSDSLWKFTVYYYANA